MKKLLIVFLALIMILGGLFLWKGGHHAVYLATAMEDWLDDDSSSQSISLEVNGLTISGNASWTEYNDRTVYILETGGYGAYIHRSVLYLDNGTAYSLPQITPDWDLVRKLLVGAVLHGRITKDDGIYHLSMETGELTLTANITAREEVDTLSLEASFPWEGETVALKCALAQTQEAAPVIPEAVRDAMVRAAMEPPVSITEPLEVLLPAMEGLLPLDADVTLAVECGILSISETVGLNVDGGGAYLKRNGETIPVTFPNGLETIDPLAAGLAILRSGSFTRNGEQAEFRIALPAEETAELVCQLVPQAASLGVSFTESEAVLVFTAGQLTDASVRSEGEIPFLVTTIPLSFSAQFDIQ